MNNDDINFLMGHAVFSAQLIGRAFGRLGIENDAITKAIETHTKTLVALQGAMLKQVEAADGR